MELSEGQKQAVEMVSRLKDFDRSARVAVLAGVAGTGKTFLVRYIAEEFGVPIVIAPTGKAALRVKESSDIPATTIHRWLYRAGTDEKSGEAYFKRKPLEEIDCGECGFIAIDEASMVNEELWNDIYDICCIKRLNILLIGDPFQLPPVQDPKAAPFNCLADDFPSNEKVFLTQIHRQALDSPIIRATMYVREGNIGKALIEIPKIQSKDLIEKADQVVKVGGAVICHKNSTRHTLNSEIRKARKYSSGTIQDGESLLVIRNDYITQLFNGEVTKFEFWETPPGGVHQIKDKFSRANHSSRFGLAVVGGNQVIIAESQITGHLENVYYKAIEKTGQKIYGKDEPFLHANFGYALTCHKSQGSEWNSVLVALEPTVQFNKEDGRRWLYTALSRAKKEVFICIGASVGGSK